ncbi:MAG: site-specific DNA-methyltransferase, partial [Cytophagales bacterium]|nr:site-specific DNA-methyltransferase [Cytophagales bacterium]
ALQMKEISDESVHLIISSPPYWNIKDYGNAQQIGYHDTYEAYLDRLSSVWSECVRVLHDGCRMCINIGDQYTRAKTHGRYRVLPIRTMIVEKCQALGLDYMGAIVWQKVATMHTSGGAIIMGSYPYPRNGIVKLDYEWILLFKKLGKSPMPSPEQKEQAKLSSEEWNKYFSGHWNFSGVHQKGHIAMFPKELPHRLIKMFSFPHELVLDPFLGSGTTMLAAKELNRNSIGYEINPDFLPIIEKKVGIKQKDVFTDSKINV